MDQREKIYDPDKDFLKNSTITLTLTLDIKARFKVTAHSIYEYIISMDSFLRVCVDGQFIVLAEGVGFYFR